MTGHPTLSDVHRVDLAERARVVLELCKKTVDVDERHELVAAAFLPVESQPATQPVYMEDEAGQLVLPLEPAATEFRPWLEAQPQPAYIGGGR